jgi:antitoxin (DNA-binding transcriptional repressor) of toxin-antitoxin stability system
MKSAMISDLKNRLSHYLRFVRNGETVLVLDRDRAIARIEPVAAGHAGDADDEVAALVRAGIMRPPKAALPADWHAQRVRASADVVGALLAERVEGQ